MPPAAVDSNDRDRGVQMRQLLCAVAALTTMPLSMAHAEGDDGKNATLELGLKLAPTFGMSLEPDSGNDPIDDSEHSLYAKATRKWGDVTFAVSPSVAYSPRYYDDRDAASALGFDLGLEGPKTVDWTKPSDDGKRKWNSIWYAGYRLGVGYDGLLDSYAYTDHIVTIGVKAQSPHYVLCSAWPGPKDLASCAEEARAGIAFTPEIAFIASTDPLRRRVTPSATVAINGPLGAMLLFGSAKIEGRFFNDKFAPDGDRQVDWRLTLDGGADISRAVHKLPPGVNVKIAGRYIRHRSNAPDERFERGFFVPTLSIIIK